jgi:hypothetical protein
MLEPQTAILQGYNTVYRERPNCTVCQQKELSPLDINKL